MGENEWKEFIVFELDEEGNKTDVHLEKSDLGDYLTPEKVYLIIYQEIKRIYLWKGGRSSVRKRFLGSRVATVVQGDIMKAGLKRCKVVAVDQGEEPQEFLNVFGIESMEIKEEDKLEDKKYLRNIEKEEMKIAEIKHSKLERAESSMLSEIKQYFRKDEKILWFKSSKIDLAENWIKAASKEKKYKTRLKEVKKASEIEIKSHEIRQVITNKRIISSHVFNQLFDFSDLPKHVFELIGNIAFLEILELSSFDVEMSDERYCVDFKVNPNISRNIVFSFENLAQEDYEEFVRVFTCRLNFLAQIPEKMKLITYVKMK
ncbi:MAG: hypothetical protein ACFFAS_10805 [Promethearchaeota archaeon]